MTHAVRPIRMEDAADVSALLDWAWFPGRSEAGWRWLCRTPRSMTARSIPVGYVVEDGDGRVAGVFGLFVQDYASRSGPQIGGTGHTLIVHPRIRGTSGALIDAVLDQPDLFGVTVLHSNDLSAPIYRKHGMVPYPIDTAKMSLVWLTDPVSIVAERLVRAGKARLDPGRRPTHDWFLADRLFETELSHLGDTIQAFGSADLDHRFDTFARALDSEGRLTARRDAVALKWRFANPDRTRAPILLAWMDGDAIGGVLLAEISKVTQVDAATLEITDLVALKGVADRAMSALVSALVRNAGRLGCARVRLPVVTREMEAALARVPGMHRRTAHDHGLAWIRPSAEALTADWRLTPYDGEFGVCFRSPPLKTTLPKAA